MTKVLIADKFPEAYIEELRRNNLEVIVEPGLNADNLAEAAKNVDILVVRSTVVNEKTINESEQLNLIIRAGAGYNNIDVAAANKKGVYVANCPGKNAVAVAELTIGLMLSLDRRIPDNVSDFRKGIWNKSEYSKANGLMGKTLAIVGYGNIGREVAKRAKEFGMSIYAKDISRIEGYGVKTFDEFSKMLPTADVISIHLPETPETKNLFNKEMLSYMKDGAYLINTSRPGVIDEEALIEAVKSKKLRVALDVFSDEPSGKSGEVHSRLMELDNVYVTHHIGASTEQAQNAVAEETVKIILTFIQSGVIAHWINRAQKTPTSYQLVVKHYDRPGVLASVLDVLRQDDINIEEMENIIFDGGVVACCTMKLDKAASSEMLNEMKANKNVLTVSHVSTEN
ncbi:MAG: phosphoglycerate dehydrogenase [Melioribacteraceae bacterium]|nr:phosphoglycerate dehydrogenase [Melioribacteraceae bacterium]MCF8411973.1 phosphoglycerate dehydrogenase [Melioribacteraceae bacterium]MCF8431615.1 phosphoglycerate dehydrogenase [Melioribacteraceae bacterium]